jgi:hypothetical protein
MNHYILNNNNLLINKNDYTWEELYNWQLNFRKNNNLTIKEFIMIIDEDTNNGYFYKRLGFNGLDYISNNQKIKNLVLNVNIKTINPNFILHNLDKKEKDKEFIMEYGLLLRPMGITLGILEDEIENIIENIIIFINVDLSICNDNKLLENNNNIFFEIITKCLNDNDKYDIDFIIGGINYNMYI